MHEIITKFSTFSVAKPSITIYGNLLRKTVMDNVEKI